MSYAVVLARKSTYEERMIRNSILVHIADVLSSVILASHVCAVAIMLNVAVMSPLRFCSRLPLRELRCFPSRIQMVEAKAETADSCEQLTNRLLHNKALLFIYQKFFTSVTTLSTVINQIPSVILFA